MNPEDIQEWTEERAAMAEYCGGMTRGDAEVFAARLARDQFVQHDELPELWGDEVA